MDWVVLDTSLSIVKAIPSSKLYELGISQPPVDFSGVIISGTLTDYFSPITYSYNYYSVTVHVVYTTICMMSVIAMSCKILIIE